MTKVFPSLKRIPLLAAVLIFAGLFIVGLFAFWSLVRSPSYESVFWQTVEGNLNSGSVVLETEISTDALGGKTLGKNRMSLSFTYETGAYLIQKTLIYDERVAEIYADPRQIESYKIIGLGIPVQEWYEQEVYASGTTVYARHDLYADPEIAGWREAFSPYFAQLPLNEWQSRQIDSELPANFQQFLMSSLANSGIFFYGRLGVAERSVVLDGLERAYKVDFDKTATYRRDGRLLYEYEVGVDYEELGNAFFEYWRANIADEDVRQQLAGIDGRTYFRDRLNSEVVYKVVIDARSRQIVEMSYPYELIGWLHYDNFAPMELVIQPYSAPVGETLIFNGFDVAVTTRVLAQNQRLPLAPPCPADSASADQQSCSDD